MKRVRDESFGGSQFKRPFGSSRGPDSCGQGQPPNSGGGGGGGGGGIGQKLTTDDALQYLKQVKEMFQEQRDKYDHFLEVMKDFKAQRIDTEGVIARVKELFKGHNNLIFGFNTFLPKGYEITMDDEEPPPKKAVEFEEAINFVNKIKKRFQSNDQVYKSFLDILNMYRKEHKNICEVYDEVSHLFEDHADLLEEFTRFLPDNSSTATVLPSHHGRSSLLRYDERNSSVPSSRPMLMDKRWRSRDRVSTSHAERDLSVERPDLGEDRGSMKLHKDSRKRNKDNRDRKYRDSDEREVEQDNTRDFNIQRLPDKKKHARKVEGFGTTPVLASSDDKNAAKSMYNQEFIFCEKVKEKLGPDNYQAFLKCLHIYSTEIITRVELEGLIADLLGKYSDLMEGFNEFLERCENLDGFLSGVIPKKSLWSDGPLQRQVKDDEKDKGPKREVDSTKEKPNKDYISKSIQELDLADCERCTPSYRLLPDDYPIPTASEKNEIGEQVLNDYWVSVTSGSEDYSFKHMRRNQYEESLFRCEDDRFELDMLLESVSSTAKRVEDLLNCINNSRVTVDGPISIDGYLTPLHLRCIERLYGDHGLEATDILRKNPAHALPVILTRLKQKQEDWTKCRAEFNKVWAEIYAKNHYKSLDHRSFYFKQQDSKNLSVKSLVSEIKEMKEKMQKEDDMLLAVAAGNKRPLVPHYEFDYPDSDLHEDLYKLIRFSCEEICTTKDQVNKVMRLWTTFLEPMLGVTARAHGVDSVEDKVQQRPARDGMAAEMGGNPAADASIANPRQAKMLVNGEGNSIADVSKCSRTNGDTTARELNHGESDPIGKEGSSGNAQPKTLNDVGVSERLLSSSLSPQNGAENRHGKSNMEFVSGPQSTLSRPLNGAEDAEDPKSTSDAIQTQSEVADASADTVANGTFTQGSKASRHLEESVGPSKGEKEDGELSPNGIVNKKKCMSYGDDGTQADPKVKRSTENQQYRDGNCEEAGAEIDADADADDEDSENASEGGDDVSGSESAGDECSREEHEEEEDGEHDELEGKAESEGEADLHYSSTAVGLKPLGKDSIASLKPLAKYVPSDSGDANIKDSRVFYGNDSFYALFRLHRILYERILAAKTNPMCSETKWRHTKDPSLVDRYSSFMTALYYLLDGSSDNAKFEDDCRAIIGNQSYVLFTLDKLLYRLVKQLQAVVSDETENKLLQLYEYETSRKPGKFADSVYHENTRVLLHEDNIYRFEFSSAPARMSIQLMDSGNEKPEMVAVSIEPNFAAYLQSDFFSVVSSRKEPPRIMLQRNRNEYAGLDENSATSKAIEGVQLSNGLECKVACSSSKISYVLDTEDFFFRAKKRRKSMPADLCETLDQARVQRFHRFLSVACR